MLSNKKYYILFGKSFTHEMKEFSDRNEYFS